jgi:outer membrane protein TolC
MEMPEKQALALALEHRLDLRTAHDQTEDAQRAVVVAADALRAELTLGGSASSGSGRGISASDSPNAKLRPEKGYYAALLTLDLPLDRTAERNAYRQSYMALEQAVRAAQELEDQVKLDIRQALRSLAQARESYRIQTEAVRLALRRVDSTDLFLQAGRADIRDVLDAQEALVSAQNALTAAMVEYRLAELQLQRDMGVLEVNEEGLWREYDSNSQ